MTTAVLLLKFTHCQWLVLVEQMRCGLGIETPCCTGRVTLLLTAAYHLPDACASCSHVSSRAKKKN
jgi:hypothetical protein